MDVQCNGGSDGFIDISVSGGSGSYTFEWTTNDGDIPPGQESNEDLSGLTSGTYVLTVRDDESCETIIEITITEPASLQIDAEVDDVLCFGENSGSIDLDVTGGTLPYYFSWEDGETTQNLVDLVAGTYHVTVTDDHDCMVTTSIEITQPDS